MDEIEELNKNLYYQSKLGGASGGTAAKDQYIIAADKVDKIFKSIKNSVSVVQEDDSGNQSIALNPIFEEKFRKLMSDTTSKIYTPSQDKQDANVEAMMSMINYITSAPTPKLMIKRMEEYKKNNPQLAGMLMTVYPVEFSASYNELIMQLEDRDYWNELWKEKAGLIESKHTIRPGKDDDDDDDFQNELDKILGGD